MPQAIITLGNVKSRIESGTLTPEASNALSDACSYEVEGAKYAMKRFRGKEQDMRKRLYHKGHRTFGTGLLDRVTSILGECGYEVVVRDERRDQYKVATLTSERMPEHWSARDYQRAIIRTAVEEGGGMIKVATGGGKTVIAGHIIRAYNAPTIFFVHTKDLLYQAYDTFADMFGKEHVGIVGDGIVNPSVVTICTIQSAARVLGVDYEGDGYGDGEDSWADKGTGEGDSGPRIRRMLDECGLVFIDECHRVAAPTAVGVLSEVKNARYRFGLSASPWRDDGADLQLEAVFGRVIADLNASGLINAGHLVRPYIRFKRVEPGRFAKSDKYSTIYEQYIVNNDRRNDLIVQDVSRKLARDLPTLVLTRSIAHGSHLRDRIAAESGRDIPFLSGKDSGAHRQDVIQALRSGRLSGLVATTIADEGLDIKPLSGLVLAGGGKSSTRALQRIGRVLRPFPGKVRAEITDFEDNARFLLDHSRRRLSIYETEPEFVVTDV